MTPRAEHCRHPVRDRKTGEHLGTIIGWGHGGKRGLRALVALDAGGEQWFDAAALDADPLPMEVVDAAS